MDFIFLDQTLLQQEVQFIERTQEEAKEIFSNGVERVTLAQAVAFDPAARKTKTKTRGKGRKKGSRRSAEDLAKMQASVFKFLKAHPGSSAGEISEGVGISAPELAVPVKKLLAAKQISKKGERSNTQYFAKGGKRS